MIYIIQAKNKPLILEKINTLNPNHLSLEWFDLNEETSQFLDELNQYSLFSETKKMYVIKNALLISDLKMYEQQGYLLDIILKDVLKNGNDYVLISENKCLANKKIKPFLEQAQLFVIEELNVKNKSTFLKNLLNQYHISLSLNDFQLLNDLLPLDMGLIQNEVKKLSYYQKHDHRLIENLITKYDEVNVFRLWEHFLTKNYQMLFLELDNLYLNKYDAIQIINVLANQIVQSILIKESLVLKKSESQIVQVLQINPYVLKKQMQFLKNWSLNQLKYIINNLYETEILIKSNNLNKEDLLKLFFIECSIER